jgi:hypothetical protein
MTFVRDWMVVAMMSLIAAFANAMISSYAPKGNDC